MQSERRHELETNTLAKGLAQWSDRLRPYTNVVLVAIAALLLAYAGASLWKSHQATGERAAWDAYELAVLEGDGEQRGLQRLASNEEHQGAQMQEWALLGWADRQLLQASRMYLTNREESNKRLTNIVGIYEQYAESGSSPEIRNRAQLGLARTYEMKGNVDEARKQYSLVEGGLAGVATQRMKELESKTVADSVKWLATVPLPKPAAPGGPGIPGKRPGFEASSPAADATGVQDALKAILGGDEKASDSKVPGAEKPPETSKPEDKSATPAESDAAPATAAPTTPPPASAATPAIAPAAETPAADVPATEAPAANSEKPADAPAAPSTVPAAQ